MPNTKFFRLNILVLCIKLVKYIELFKIQGIGLRYKWYIYIIFQRPSARIYQIRNPAHFQFFLHLKKKDIVSGKSTMTFWYNLAYMVSSFVFLLQMTIMASL